MKEPYSKYKFIKSKRKLKNLKKLLTKARFDAIPIDPEVKRCNGEKGLVIPANEKVPEGKRTKVCRFWLLSPLPLKALAIGMWSLEVKQ